MEAGRGKIINMFIFCAKNFWLHYSLISFSLTKYSYYIITKQHMISKQNYFVLLGNFLLVICLFVNGQYCSSLVFWFIVLSSVSLDEKISYFINIQHSSVTLSLYLHSITRGESYWSFLHKWHFLNGLRFMRYQMCAIIY